MFATELSDQVALLQYGRMPASSSAPAAAPQPTSSFNDENRLLTSWKEIAAYFGKGVRTVQRWERTMQLPVHRPGNSTVVMAHTRELEAWSREQTLSTTLVVEKVDRLLAELKNVAESHPVLREYVAQRARELSEVLNSVARQE